MNEAYNIRTGPWAGPLQEDFRQVATDLYPSAVAAQKNSMRAFLLPLTTIVVDNGTRPVARLCLYDNPLIRHQGQKTLLFGNLESSDDTACFRQLMQEAEQEAGKRDCAFLLGPMNGSTWDAYRCPLGAQEAPFLSEDLQQPYYAARLADNGYTIAERYYSTVSRVSLPEGSSRPPALQWPEQGCRIRPVRPDSLEDDLRRLYPLCQKAFAANPYFAPISETEFLQRQLPLAAWLDEDFVLVGENAAGALVAFLLAFPDALMPHRLVLKTIARSPDHQLPGLITLMGTQLYEKAALRGYTHIVHAYMHDGNRSRQRSADFGGTPFRSYALFVKPLHG